MASASARSKPMGWGFSAREDAVAAMTKGDVALSPQVTDQCAIDLDQRDIEAQLTKKTPESFEVAKTIYIPMEFCQMEKQSLPR